MNNPFKELEIKGVFLARAEIHSDTRGWLCETFRADWLAGLGLERLQPAMGYVSLTNPGVARGPHDHRFQTDCFAFIGPSDFKIYLWDNRPDSPSFHTHLQLVLGASAPGLLIVPPGVVHGYKNIGNEPGLVHNFPDKLFRGWNRTEAVDEIRYEDDPNSPFRIDF
ncbi:MAG: dTDP-4-dehydrorhamnose 3,5-epimerase family protein [candidate division WOR-3 bacterium]